MMKILVVDDEPPIREWMQMCINRNFPGLFAVDAASNGAVALDLFRLHKHEIIITDIVMTNMDGLELLSEIYQLNPLACFVVLSSHDNFHYVRTALRYGITEYILKQEINETYLCQVIIKCQDKIRRQESLTSHRLNQDTYLRDLIYNSSQDITLEVLSQHHVCLTAMPLFTFAVCFAGSAPRHFVLPERITESLANLQAFSYADNTYLFFGNLTVKPGGPKPPAALWLYLQDIWNLNKGCTVISGPVFDHVGQLRERLLKVTSQLYLSFYRQDTVLPYTVSDPSSKSAVLDKKIQKLTELLRHGEQTAIPGLLELYSADIIRRMPRDIYTLKWECGQLLDAIANRSPSFPVNERQTLKERIFESAAWTVIPAALAEAYQWIEQKSASSHYGRHVSGAIAYLEENYATLTGLNEVAEQLYLSPEHLSRLFKTETGQNFISYLNDYRLKKAKELLEQTDLKVHQIAEQIGYSSLSYFSKLFKEAYHLNPFRYRSLLEDREK